MAISIRLAHWSARKLLRCGRGGGRFDDDLEVPGWCRGRLYDHAILSARATRGSGRGREHERHQAERFQEPRHGIVLGYGGPIARKIFGAHLLKWPSVGTKQTPSNTRPLLSTAGETQVAVLLSASDFHDHLTRYRIGDTEIPTEVLEHVAEGVQ